MCLLRWKQVIERGNLTTQGLGLLLASVLPEERRLGHCLLNLLPRRQRDADQTDAEISEPPTFSSRRPKQRRSGEVCAGRREK